MRRVNINQSADSQDNLLFHLARYKFISRLISKKDHLLEIGCGTGYGSRFLSDYAKNVVASDLDKKIFAQAKNIFKKDNLIFTNDFESKAPYDVIVCLEVIEHCTIEKGLDLLLTIKKLLAPGGVAFISTPRRISNPTENRKKFHVHEYDFTEFKNTLESIFSRALVFTQVDEMISTHHQNCAWNFIACCYL